MMFAMMFDNLWHVVLAATIGVLVLAGAAAFALRARAAAAASRRLSPLGVTACIFSLDEGSQSSAKILALLSELRSKGFLVALATDSPRSVVERRGNDAVWQAMDAVVTCDDVLVRKPAADLFHEAARRLRVDPTRCLVFDDAPAGLVAAHSAGMLTAAVGPAAKNRGAAADSPSVDWALRDISSFDTREIALVRPAPTDGHADAGAADIASGLAALAQLLPAGSALRKCLEGGRGSYHPV